MNHGGPRGATPLVAARASHRCPLHRSSGERKSPPQFVSAALPQEAEGYALNGKNRGGTWTVCSRAGRRLPGPALACWAAGVARSVAGATGRQVDLTIIDVCTNLTGMWEKNLLKIPWIHGPMWIAADGPYTIGPANLPWPTS